jgi:hypothetical protein
LAALNRYGLGNCGIGSPKWHAAIEALGHAKLAPTPEKVEAARLAIRAVALEAEALLEG